METSLKRCASRVRTSGVPGAGRASDGTCTISERVPSKSRNSPVEAGSRPKSLECLACEATLIGASSLEDPPRRGHRLPDEIGMTDVAGILDDRKQEVSEGGRLPPASVTPFRSEPWPPLVQRLLHRRASVPPPPARWSRAVRGCPRQPSANPNRGRSPSRGCSRAGPGPAVELPGERGVLDRSQMLQEPAKRDRGGGDGGRETRQGSRPAHFHSRFARCRSRKPRSVAASSPGTGVPDGRAQPGS